MKSRLLAAAAAAVIGVTAGAATFAQGQRASQVAATTDIKGKGVTGTAEFAEHSQGTGSMVEITVQVSGLAPGKHGVHLHAIGKCEPDFTAAGGHFDPGPASNTDPDANHPYHMGDIPNLEVGADGRGAMKITTTRVTLSAGPLSVFDADGTAIIIHGNEDQGITGAPKSGVSGGPRVACGVLMKK
ncbi:MAG: superoxide dismutase family protein [Acidobacteria bacterium]|nr:superoxide dismutase family protein [Acidobacteriota bacterium]